MRPPLAVPAAVADALGQGGTLAVSISGGKDSQALLSALADEYALRGWTGPIYAVHAHLGRAEWPQSLAHCRRIAEQAGVELVVVHRPQGDLVDQIRARALKLAGTGKAPWPDAQNRYCTSDQKRGQLDTQMRNPWPTATMRYCTADQKRGQILKVHRRSELIVAAMGMRGGESAARAKRPVVAVRKQITAKAIRDLAPDAALSARGEGQRLALDWLPLHHWGAEDVWAQCGTSSSDLTERQFLYRAGRVGEALDGWPAHPAYVYGNQRLSCALCVLASQNDLINGARHNPELYREYVAIERESGFAFQQGRSLASLQPALAS